MSLFTWYKRLSKWWLNLEAGSQTFKNGMRSASSFREFHLLCIADPRKIMKVLRAEIDPIMWLLVSNGLWYIRYSKQYSLDATDFTGTLLSFEYERRWFTALIKSAYSWWAQLQIEENEEPTFCYLQKGLQIFKLEVSCFAKNPRNYQTDS